MKTIAEQLNVTEFPFRIWDSKKRLIYFEESNKRWAKYEHDSEGNVIYYVNSNGFWWRAQYDANGNKIYFENSRGEIEDNRPIIDNRPKPYEDKVIEIDGVKYKLVKL